MRVYDITRPISTRTAVWPGDRPFQAEWSAILGDGDSPVNVGAISLSTHTGTHADAPLHYAKTGNSIDRIPLDRFMGTALVVDVGAVDSIRVEHVHGLPDASRVLFKTGASRHDEDAFVADFAWIDPDVIRFLGTRGVVLIGTDAPSVDPFDSKDLPSHIALEAENMVNLENLYLRDVPAGTYTLFALPMKLIGLDAAPVRAVLLE